MSFLLHIKRGKKKITFDDVAINKVLEAGMMVIMCLDCIAVWQAWTPFSYIYLGVILFNTHGPTPSLSLSEK